MASRYDIVECKAWVREGFSPRAAHVIEHEGFELQLLGYRITRDGVKLFTAYPPFKTREEAQERIAQLA